MTPNVTVPRDPWRSIDKLPECDDLFWFLRWDSIGGFTVDGPRAPQRGGYDFDEWEWFAPCESPPSAAPQGEASERGAVGQVEWSDEQCVAFMATALRHVQYERGSDGPTCDDIRMGVRRANALTQPAAAPTAVVLEALAAQFDGMADAAHSDGEYDRRETWHTAASQARCRAKDVAWIADALAKPEGGE